MRESLCGAPVKVHCTVKEATFPDAIKPSLSHETTQISFFILRCEGSSHREIRVDHRPVGRYAMLQYCFLFRCPFLPSSIVGNVIGSNLLCFVDHPGVRASFHTQVRGVQEYDQEDEKEPGKKAGSSTSLQVKDRERKGVGGGRQTWQ